MDKFMYEPSHPGEILKELWLDGLDVSIGAFAKHIGVSRQILSSIINKRAGVTAEMAIRFSRALDTTPDIWLNLQATYDIWLLEQKNELQGIEKLSQIEATAA